MFFHHLLGDVNGPTEFLSRLNDMIRRHHHHDRVVVLPSDERGPQADACGGVAAAGLTNDALCRKLRQLQTGLIAMLSGGDDPGALRRHLSLDAFDGLLQQSAVARQAKELLGAFHAAARPKTRAAAACHDERVEHKLSPVPWFCLGGTP